MKKLFLFFSIAVFFGCDSSASYWTIYTYENNTEWYLTITTDNIHYSDGTPYEFMTISPGNYYRINIEHGNLMQNHFAEPFSFRPETVNSVIISNEIKEVVCRRSDGDDLLNLRKYTLVSSEKTKREYKYVFEPSFFDNGTPIEQKVE